MPTNKTPMTKVTFRVHRGIWKSVQHRAVNEGTTAASVVTDALTKYLRNKIKGKPHG